MNKEALPKPWVGWGADTETGRQNPNLWQVVWKWMVLFWLALFERLDKRRQGVFPSDEGEY